MFRAELTQFETFDVIMCKTFLLALCWNSQSWFCKFLKATIESFDHLVKAFKTQFIESQVIQKKTWILYYSIETEDELLAQYLSNFT